MLLVRGAPLPGESLSSYRQRIWMRNGYRLFPVFSPELRRTDPDLLNRDQTLDAVARHVNRSPEEIAALSLRSHPLLSGRYSMNSNIPRWMVTLQYARSDFVGAGSMFCPACLLDSEEPYFRAIWRLSISLTCPKHQIQMLDRCPACSFPGWPYAAATASGFFSKKLDIDQCPQCLFRLRDSPSVPETDSALLLCAKAIISGKSPWTSGPLAQISLLDCLSGLRVIMNLAIKLRTRPKFVGSDEFGDVIADLHQKEITRMSFDRLDIHFRRKLVSSAWKLMDDWPNRFLTFAHQYDLIGADFSEERPSAPSWCISVIDQELSQPGRLVTPENVEMAIQRLTLQGKAVTAEAVGRLVGSRDAKVVQARLGKRRTATVGELIEMVAGLQRYMASSTSRRATAQFVRARNVAAVGIAILGRMSLEDVMKVRRSDLQRVVAPARCNPILSQHLQPTLDAALDKMALFWSQRSVGLNDSFFVPHRGASHNRRGPQGALCQAMKGLDGRLWRGHWVFFDLK